MKPDNIAGAVAARWLALSPEAHERTGVMAPGRALRQAINGHIRERLARDGVIHGPAMAAERLVSKGYTNAEKALAGNYGAGDVVAFRRPYKRIGVERGDERRVAGVDHERREVLLDDGKGATVAWKPAEIGGRTGGTEVYRAESIELRAANRIRWTRNDAALEGIGEMPREAAERSGDGAGAGADEQGEDVASASRSRELPPIERGKGASKAPRQGALWCRARQLARVPDDEDGERLPTPAHRHRFRSPCGEIRAGLLGHLSRNDKLRSDLLRR